ncbi:MAG: relaxase/mobilization nuclease domain-containing protein [bacterium]
MIAVSSSSKSFRAIAHYLTTGRTGQESERVAWTSSRNLPVSEPETAAKLMRATAAQNVHVEKPVYHLAISFDPTDRVDRATMERVADRVIQELQLAEYQIVIVAHRDRAHQHVHLFVNRVHPETLKAWNRWQDQPEIQRVLRELEKELGLREVQGTLFDREVKPIVRAGQRSSAPELTADARQGPERSLVGADRAPGLDSSHVREQEVAHAIRVYVEVVAMGASVGEGETAVRGARARLGQLSLATERAERASAAFDESLKNVFREPTSARRQFEQIVSERGIEAASTLLSREPERFGALVTVERAKFGGLVREDDASAALRTAPDAARLGQAAASAEDGFWREAASSRVERLDDALARELVLVYREPAIARATFHEEVGKHGVEAAAESLRTTPERFGELRLTEGEKEMTTARVHARAAADLSIEAAQARTQAAEPRRATGSPAEERAHATAAVDAARAHADQLTAEWRKMPRRDALEHDLGRAIRMLAPREFERLRELVTAPHLAMARQIRGAVREAMIGKEGHEL